jgi:RES domain-containing protein
MSENRSLSVLEVLVHLTDTLPDKFVLGSAEISDEISRETLSDAELPADWQTLSVAEQSATRRIGDEWVESLRSAALLVPSVVTSESNLLINPAHRDFDQIKFHDPIPFVFDLRLLFRSHPMSITELT